MFCEENRHHSIMVVPNITGKHHQAPRSAQVGLRGSVVRAANIAPLITELSFTCSRCSSEVASTTVEGRFEYPASCPKKCSSMLIEATVHPHIFSMGFLFLSFQNLGFTGCLWLPLPHLRCKLKPIGIFGDDGFLPESPSCFMLFSFFKRFLPVFFRGRFARFTVNRDKCRAIDWQRIRLQEDFAELAASGGGPQRRMPRTVDCDLKRSLVGSCVPGDVVTWMAMATCREL